jgi:hypothetical protein
LGLDWCIGGFVFFIRLIKETTVEIFFAVAAVVLVASSLGAAYIAFSVCCFFA